MSRSPSRAALALVAAAALTVPLCAAGPAAAAPGRGATPTHTLTVDPAATGPEIGEHMYGVFYEDINNAADGGLYAELVRNRSFEFSGADRAGWDGLTAWTPTAVGGGRGTATTVDDSGRLNERNRTYLRLDLSSGTRGTYGVTNSGYDQGLAVEAGELYDVSVWARSDAPGGTPLTVALTGADGRALSGQFRVQVRGDGWRQYRGTVRARSTTDAARLSVQAAGSGTLRLDMVSAFPRETFMGRPNGLRADLAEKIAALEPGFVRFPGGCIVNTGSHEGYDAASGWERQRSYQWKDTVGPVEQRATNANFWGYNQSYGLGYYEYFQFAEDIGAMPLPVVPALLTGCGQNEATDDPELLQRHVQDTLDLIEFANGPATSTWGRVRAGMGHPEPFGLTHLGIGNEENLPEEYAENFALFRDAITAAHPEITLIYNSGPDDTGAVFDAHWANARELGAEVVDEHYYNSPAWFLRNNDRYDSYDRSGPDVFLGEYASLDGKLANALAEASYMTGLERNADVVRMASYAPLLADVAENQWRPDMIWFDGDESWGSASYEVQKLFMTNVGDRVVPSTATGGEVPAEPIAGGVGLSTWRTAARYDDVRVTTPGGEVLFSDDFSDGDGKWSPVTGTGEWSVTGGAYVQSDTTAENTLVRTPDLGVTDYDVSLTATKTAGDEGFLVGFGVDGDDYYWWNLGGWNGTQDAVEKTTDGAKEVLLVRPGTIETGRTYDLRVEVRGTSAAMYVDGELWGTITDDAATQEFSQVVTRDDDTGELIVKVVNNGDEPARTRVDLGAEPARPTARMTVIAGDPQAENTRESQPVAPETSTVHGIERVFTREFPAHSVTFLRIPTR
ncbi:alpha-L-arabinofuranosidase C-terminal domain-containing protein [Kineococcus esterisolvens]|uniref:alpha-L-arabinofuranosidase C-terminal domain-containing protein n=1 Tax=unclassified Kineococcus TaxID=2621656 RepID=UPI003D7EE09C